MSRTARIAVGAVGTAFIGTAAAGSSWLIAALDGPLWAIALVVAVGFGALVGLGCGLAGGGRDPSWREREGRRDGYVHDCNEHGNPEVAITRPEVPLTAAPEWRDFFNVLDERAQDCDRNRWSS